MKLSVVIVSYNVRPFLEQCLHTVMRALDAIPSEVFVVDNNSADDSVSMVKQKFSSVRIIENKENRGFSHACNQVIRQAAGEYVLLLNPDTVVEEDTFRKSIEFMNTHPEAGGLGVKMLDGKGRFLPESKRSLPTPFVAFCKMFGLSALFPRSKIFGRYHAGYLDRNSIHEIEVLSGAFMMIRREAMDKTGLLDESFFMYGEDIDLSYRLLKEGYKNYYYPHTRIIHYKGESTKKTSVNYVITFYKAMITFAKKHYSGSKARWLIFLIGIAIYFRAAVAMGRRLMYAVLIPLIDAATVYGGMGIIKSWYENNIRFPEGGSFAPEVLTIAFPLYTVIMLFSVFICGGYDAPVKIKNIVKGAFSGTVVILIIYALLSEDYRFSRVLILAGMFWTTAVFVSLRYFLRLIGIRSAGNLPDRRKKLAIVGNVDEAERVSGLIQKASRNASVSLVTPGPGSLPDNNGAYFTRLREIIRVQGINEVVFCARDLSSQTIIEQMTQLDDMQVDYKIAPPNGLFIIGSNSANASGDIYGVSLSSIGKTTNRRNKRLFDVAMAMLFLVFLPAEVCWIKRPLGFVRNIFSVLAGRKSWVGYCADEKNGTKSLPAIKKGILCLLDALDSRNIDSDIIQKLNITYAEHYRIGRDFHVLLNGLRSLGRTP